MHRYRGLFRQLGAFARHQFSADYTISMLGFDFRQGQVYFLTGVRTGSLRYLVLELKNFTMS